MNETIFLCVLWGYVIVMLPIVIYGFYTLIPKTEEESERYRRAKAHYQRTKFVIFK